MAEFSPDEILNREHLAPDKTGDNIAAKRVASYAWDGTNWQRVLVGPNGNLQVISGSAAVRWDDTTTTNVMYVGRALVGTTSSAATWAIKKIDTTSGGIITWADGNASYDNVWDNRASLTYS